MKQFVLLIILFLITACSGNKKAIDNTEAKKVEPKVEIKKDTDFMIREDVTVDNINLKKLMSDSITLTKVKEVLPRKTDSLEFHQDLSKRTFNSADEFWTSFLVTHVSDNGNVNYETFRKDYKGLRFYIKTIQNFIPKENASKEEKLAYWINAYNALTIDLILRNYPLKSIKEIKDPWSQRLWKFGDKWLNLNHIEHNILRKMDEPRIHFAIVCASYSCPKLQNEAFTASNLDAQLTEATKEFLCDTERNNISQNSLELSKIFKWFAKDFKTEGSLIDFLNKYREIEISSKAKKSFKDYNWGLNN
ncbi:MAG: DUF547 domain-containing protein [Winogradskyella sp.]|uniref:DUF547 domain-containing protein n=1 Tax=Winogradskyella sp. TaxID=1883156 RepID=UPI0017E78685|nr:DUF547 domain-containing protein [Winogradskyella sp.]MBT8245952.1 DUF547 domain-containing protein [Winogradskyella sp.]NNK21772.1 DUF547 domain-containing protein [Winogradskyella sp.]